MNICRRVVPSARRMPISRRRCKTEKLTLLYIRNKPTSSASRLIAVRFVMKAALISAVVRVRAAAGSSVVSAGNSASSFSCEPVSPSASRTSMRESLFGWPNQTCAVAMSAVTRLSSPVAAPLVYVPSKSAECCLPPATSSKRSPAFNPSVSTVVCDIITAPGNVSMSLNRDCVASVSDDIWDDPAEDTWRENARISCSANRSTPRTCSERPSTVTYPSTTGAMLRKPCFARSAT